MTDTNRARGNFGLMLFCGYVFLCRRFLWLRTFMRIKFREYALSCKWFSGIWNFGSMGFAIILPYPGDIITYERIFYRCPDSTHQCPEHRSSILKRQMSCTLRWNARDIDNQFPDIVDQWIVFSFHLDICQQWPGIDHWYLLFSVYKVMFEGFVLFHFDKKNSNFDIIGVRTGSLFFLNHFTIVSHSYQKTKNIRCILTDWANTLVDLVDRCKVDVKTIFGRQSTLNRHSIEIYPNSTVSYQ